MVMLQPKKLTTTTTTAFKRKFQFNDQIFFKHTHLTPRKDGMSFKVWTVPLQACLEKCVMCGCLLKDDKWLWILIEF